MNGFIPSIQQCWKSYMGKGIFSSGAKGTREIQVSVPWMTWEFLQSLQVLGNSRVRISNWIRCSVGTVTTLQTCDLQPEIESRPFFSAQESRKHLILAWFRAVGRKGARIRPWLSGLMQALISVISWHRVWPLWKNLEANSTSWEDWVKEMYWGKTLRDMGKVQITGSGRRVQCKSNMSWVLSVGKWQSRVWCPMWPPLTTHGYLN